MRNINVIVLILGWVLMVLQGCHPMPLLVAETLEAREAHCAVRNNVNYRPIHPTTVRVTGLDESIAIKPTLFSDRTMALQVGTIAIATHLSEINGTQWVCLTTLEGDILGWVPLAQIVPRRNEMK